jgi:hypothetical protein
MTLRTRLRWLADIRWLGHVTDYDAPTFLADHQLAHARFLNAGAGGVRLGPRSVNLDLIAGPETDIVADLNALPDLLGAPYPAIVCNAALQYTTDPRTTLNAFRRLLVPGGYLYLDVPFVQPYCLDQPDRWRFTLDGLRGLVEEAGFRDIHVTPSLRSGSALWMLAWRIAGDLTPWRVPNTVLRVLTAFLLAPLRYVRTSQPAATAGGFSLIARKPL